MSVWDWVETLAHAMAAIGVLYLGWEILQFGRMVYGL